MAVRRVIAAIDVVINGERNMDRLAQSYVALEQTANRVNTHMRSATQPGQWAHANFFTAPVQGARSLGGAFQNMVGSIVRNREELDRHSTTTRSFAQNVVSLTKSMILFSVLLPLVRLPLQAIDSFRDFITVGGAWMHQMRSINSLLQLNEDQFNSLDDSMRKISGRWGVGAKELGDSAKQISSTLGVINNTKGAYTDLELTVKLTNDIAQMSRASFESMGSVQEAVFTIFAAGRLDVEQTDFAMQNLFKTVQVGRTTFAEFNTQAGNFLPLAQEMIDAAPSAAGRLERLTGVLQTFAAASLVLGSASASVGLGQVFQNIGRETPKQHAVVSAMQTMRRKDSAAYGSEDYNISGPALYGLNDIEGGATSAEQMFGRLNKVLGTNSPLVDAEIERLRKLNKLQDEQATRATLAQRLAGMYFNNNVRAVRAYQAITPENLAAVKAQWGTGTDKAITDPTGPVGRATEEWLKDPVRQAERVTNAMDLIKVKVFDSMSADLLKLHINIGALFERMLDDPRMSTGNFFARIQFAAGYLMEAFSTYFRSGGKEQFQAFGREFGQFVGGAITAFFKGGPDSVLFEAAGAFSTAFVEGIAQTLPKLLAAVISSSLTRAIVEYGIVKYAMGGRPGSTAAAALVTGGLETAHAAGGLPDIAASLVGSVILGGVTFAASRRMMGRRAGQGGPTLGDMVQAARTRLGGRAAAAETQVGMLNNTEFNANIAAQNDLSARFQALTPQQQNAIVSNPNHPMMVEYNALQAAERGNPQFHPVTGAPIMQSSVRTPTTWRGLLSGARSNVMGVGMQALFAIPSLIAASQETDEREKWSGFGSTAGGFLGGVGGWLAGGALAAGTAGAGTLLAPALGMGGGIAGGMAGGGIGGWLFDIMHPNAKGAGTGASVTDADAPARSAMAEVFAAGMDASSTPELLAGILSVLINNPAAAMGGVRTTGRAAAPVTAGGASRSLESSFVNQKGVDGELSAGQAAAACGPAAATFFARAYGRNPTLKEAYALQNALQLPGGGDISTHDGSNINTLGQAVTQLSGQKVDVQGSGVDFARLQSNAQAGIPGILNIGPSGKFPGHYFQIGGYNAATGKYKVGPSGLGGKTEMTLDEMKAYGPVQGAILGTAPPTNTGAAGATGSAGAPVTGTLSDRVRGNMDSINAASAATGVPPAVIAAIMDTEGGGPRSTSVSGARGFMQIKDNIAAKYGVTDSYDPAQNIMGGTKYLNDLYKETGSWENAAAAYFGAYNRQTHSINEGAQDANGTSGGTYVNKFRTNLKNYAGSGTGTGTGMGEGGGGPVTITIANLMNVEHMDGSTDVRALLGQMADMLTQLSNGGSVVGQTGNVTP